MPASSLDTLLRFGAGPLVDHGAEIPAEQFTQVARMSGLRLTLLGAQQQLPKRSPLLSHYSALYKQAQDIYSRWFEAKFKADNAAGRISGAVSAPSSANHDRYLRRQAKRKIAC
jgi:hypothetical protein